MMERIHLPSLAASLCWISRSCSDFKEVILYLWAAGFSFEKSEVEPDALQGGYQLCKCIGLRFCESDPCGISISSALTREKPANLISRVGSWEAAVGSSFPPGLLPPISGNICSQHHDLWLLHWLIRAGLEREVWKGDIFWVPLLPPAVTS